VEGGGWSGEVVDSVGPRWRGDGGDGGGARPSDESGGGIWTRSSDEGDENIWIGRRERIWMEGEGFGSSGFYVTLSENCWMVQQWHRAHKN
jgi:hypothetical protein